MSHSWRWPLLGALLALASGCASPRRAHVAPTVFGVDASSLWARTCLFGPDELERPSGTTELSGVEADLVLIMSLIVDHPHDARGPVFRRLAARLGELPPEDLSSFELVLRERALRATPETSFVPAADCGRLISELLDVVEQAGLSRSFRPA